MRSSFRKYSYLPCTEPLRGTEVATRKSLGTAYPLVGRGQKETARGLTYLLHS
ncbi:hypothetical protein [Chlorogloeopsis sp. ULAP02]|uniref:hypothetical protein n=1 Tax=Chlorogloeopsis sp. ULAP02 TaxID=3107926 RepID=UPI0031358AB7